MTNKLTAIDLFAGAGGFSLAAHNIGFEVLAAIELNLAASNTYKKNIIERLGQKTNLLTGDISEFSPAQLRSSLGLKIGELKLILGGPPCQGFSSHRIKGAGINDPRNKLLLRYYDFVEEFQPQAFLVENVAGLFWEKHATYLNAFKSLAQENGYNIKFCDTLNAKDYGVPQTRKRAFILGVRKDVDHRKLIFPPTKKYFSPNSIEVKKYNLPTWRPASSVFERLTDELIERYIEEHFKPHSNYSEDEARTLLNNLEYGEIVNDNDPCNIHMRPSDKMVRRFKSTRLNGSRMDASPEFELKCHANGYGGHADVYGRVIIHLPSNTMTTGCNNPSKGRFTHPWKNHGFTLRHAARLQTFPDTFIFTGNKTEQAKQIGNAVPTLLAEKLISSIVL